MAAIDIELDGDLIEGVKQLAVRYYGDSSDTSIAFVAESALAMRLLWQDLVKGADNEIEEPIAKWDFGMENQHRNSRLKSEVGYSKGGRQCFRRRKS